MSKKFNDWLKVRQEEFKNQLLSEENGQKLAELGLSLKVTVSASRKRGHEVIERDLSEEEWERITKEVENQPEILRFLQLLEDIGNIPTPFADLRALSGDWLDWTRYVYINALFRKRKLWFRFSCPPEDKRLAWNVRRYRLYPIQKG